jgi:hypothetical protein
VFIRVHLRLNNAVKAAVGGIEGTASEGAEGAGNAPIRIHLRSSVFICG